MPTFLHDLHMSQLLQGTYRVSPLRLTRSSVGGTRFRSGYAANKWTDLPEVVNAFEDPPLGPLPTRRSREGNSRRDPSVWVANQPRKGSSDIPLSSRVQRVQADLVKIEHAGSKHVLDFLQKHVVYWRESMKATLSPRLLRFGIPRDQIDPLLQQFCRDVLADVLSNEAIYDTYSIGRLARYDTTHLPDPQHFIDAIYTSVFYQWATDHTHRQRLSAIVPESTIDSMSRLVKASDRLFPAHEFPNTRRASRKVIMHVGPTNSGKTYHALRALAASQRGIYCGPLRLLAHEIWERLNLGMIRPANVPDDEQIPASVTGMGNPNWVRPCNMITGEETKVVDPSAPLTSCTVEMLVTNSVNYDVAVIDEIQMISDPERGFAWTDALLGINAKEIHLCGEEVTVPLVKELLADTGDELIINRYERLTPLVVEPKSLQSRLTNVQKGDCIVAFGRNSIFNLKKKIEASTKLRCAVVYGRLPPEIRSSQADLFNATDSGYDVMIGSDAIGMGLNLKIKRIVFSEVTKFHGGRVTPLSVSQTKQIAGRAGRFGLHGDDVIGGVTTLGEQDMQFLRDTLPKPVKPLTAAILGSNLQTCIAIASVLPSDASMQTIQEVHVFVSRVKPHFLYRLPPLLDKMTIFIDSLAGILSMEDRLMLMYAPVPWRDTACVEFLAQLISDHRTKYDVDLLSLLAQSHLLEALRIVEQKMAHNDIKDCFSLLMSLESLHKILGLYSWLSYRKPVAFHSQEAAMALKLRTEKAMHWVLLNSTTLRRPSPRKFTAPVKRPVDYQSGRIPKHLQHLQQKELQAVA